MAELIVSLIIYPQDDLMQRISNYNVNRILTGDKLNIIKKTRTLLIIISILRMLNFFYRKNKTTISFSKNNNNLI
jgi:hypothetical protein